MEKMAELRSFSQSEVLRMLADVITHHRPLKDVEIVLTSGVDVNASVHKGLRPLHYAAYENNIDVMQMLLSHGADVNTGDDVGYTPLHIASKYGNLRAVNFLLRNGAVVNFLEEDSGGPPGSKVLAELTVNPLSLALEENHPECADALLSAGANANETYFLGSELTLVPMKHTRCIEVLLAHGADANSYTRSGMTALMRACREQQLATVKALLHYGADVNLTCHPKIEQKRAIHFAAMVGDVQITKALIDGGADLHKPESFGYTPLEFAISTEKVEICKLLLEHGANPNELNDEDVSPMQVACSTPDLCRTKELLELLLEHGALPNYSRHNFSYCVPCLTPLIEYFVYQAEYNMEVIRTLLAYGADVNFALSTRLVRIKDNCGILVHVAKLKDREDIFNLLVNAARSFNETEIRKDRSMSAKQKEVLLEEAACPRPLRHLVRLWLRSFFSSPLPPKLKSLPLPPFLINYLLFQT